MITPPPLTDRQQDRLDEWLTETNTRTEWAVHPHDLAWIVRDESRPGRGHDVQAWYVDGDVFACLGMDPYGNGWDVYGTVDVEHNSDDEECRCDECIAYRSEGDDDE